MGADPDRRLAARSVRLLAWFLDAVIAGFLFIPLNPLLYSDEPEPGLFFALGVPAMILVFVYLIAFDGGRRGATPGKRILGIRVADEQSGSAIGYRRATVRRLGYAVGGLALYLGWLWIIFDRRRQAWHDKVAHSVVVRAR